MSDAVRILYVDDSSEYADVAAEHLERHDQGFDVVTAYGAEAGLECLAGGDFDCVVSDYQMPGTDGLEFLKEIRKRYGTLPFILATGRGSEGVASAAISAGVTDYIPKQRGADQYAVLSNRIRNAVERYRSEHSAAQSERRLKAIFDNAFTFTGLLDPDGTVLRVNHTALEWGGVEAADVVGTPLWETVWFQLNDETRTTAREAVERARDGRFYREEIRLSGVGGVTVVDFSVRPVTDEQDEVTLLILEARDITERVQHEARIAGLNAMLGDFLTADEAQAIADIFIEAATTTLDLPVTVLALFDEETGTLEPAAATSAATEQLDVDAVLQGETAWNVYADAEPAIVTQIDDGGGGGRKDPEQLTIHPIGRHGVFITAIAAESIDGWMDDFLRTVANSVQDALTRIDREALLEAHEAELEERNEQLTKVNRINQFIRSIDRALVTASSSTEMYRTVCEELAEPDPYSLAWIGTYDAARNEVVSAFDAGDDADFIDAVAVDHEENPAALAARTRTVQVIENIRNEPPYGVWQRAGLARGYQGVIALPIVYRDRLYGVLTLFTDDSDLIQMEREVLEELVTNLANAVSAVESKRALVSEAVVELDLAIDASRVSILQPFVEQPDASVDLEAVVPGADGQYRVFFSTSGVDADTLASGVETSPVITEHSAIGPGRYEFVVTSDCLIGWLFDQGVTPHSLSDGDDPRLVVALAEKADVREFVESFESRFGKVSLRSRQERERSSLRSADFRARLIEELTERQQEILHVAYASGYFDSPRKQTGSEIAETLGISQPTFSDHLRQSQQTFLRLLFESDDAALAF